MLVIVAAFGAVAGSFAGVVAERLYTGQSWGRGRSRCNSCARILSPSDLVPVVSWLVHGGRCRTCGSGVPVRYLLLEGALALTFALSYLKLGLSLPFLVLAVALFVLAVIILYDLRHTVIPQEASMLLVALSLLFALLTSGSMHAFGGALFSAGVIGGAFVLAHVLSRGRAMGLGDAPLAFSLSLIAAPLAVTGLIFSFWIGALCGIIILVKRQGGPKMGIEVPFAPYLACGYLLAFFTGWNLFPL
ncbi:MAG TPA: prepilin peptidase [Candidatus Paceibacterota bacterium]|nr:prepilin peptidase [Candidatus Paceibacterota bacterium]